MAWSYTGFSTSALCHLKASDLGHTSKPAVVLANGQKDVAAVLAEEVRQELGTHHDVEVLQRAA